MTHLTCCRQCGEALKRPRPSQLFCSASCRAAHWRSEHLARCPNCGAPVAVQIVVRAVPNVTTGVST